tara:strand:- start:1676 stop:2806 length:1131 start_codon:yes stop_codon:yes gene_type:complete
MMEFHGAALAEIAINCAANFAVMVGSLRIKDRLDRKIAGVLSRTVLVHGALAFFILVSRMGYSGTIVIAAPIMSAILGCVFMYVEHRVTRVRAALVGPGDPLAASLGVHCDHIENPDHDLRGYDIVLTPPITDLTSEWAGSVSRAMMAGTPVRQLVEFIEEDQGIVAVEHFDLDHLPVGGLTSYRTRKRLMDIALVLITAPVTLPMVTLGAFLVGVTMGRPVIFVQDRVGLGGRVFRILKLRTMRAEAPGAETGTTKIGDSRITRLGYWLRRSRIDELPQLWNVLKGDMSIIGPRPEWTLLSEGYSESLPAYGYRHLVRPGITGWAQVRGGYASDLAETRQKVGYDLFYIKNMSFSLDIQILLRTVWTLLTGSGAR